MIGRPRVHAFGKSDVGLRRSLNEDSYFIDQLCHCFSVADGVGGAAAGEVASQMFISVVSEFDWANNLSVQQAASQIKKVFFKANSEIFSQAQNNPDQEGMSCTAELFLIYENAFTLGHVGDSRTYRYRKEKLTQLTRDHSFIQEQIDLGHISEHEAKSHRYRNMILRAVGVDDSIDLDLISGEVAAGDIFLVCSDGLTDMVEENNIADCLNLETGVEEKVLLLIDQANQAGGKDNITVIIVEVM